MSYPCKVAVIQSGLCHRDPDYQLASSLSDKAGASAKFRAAVLVAAQRSALLCFALLLAHAAAALGES